DTDRGNVFFRADFTPELCWVRPQCRGARSQSIREQPFEQPGIVDAADVRPGSHGESRLALSRGDERAQGGRVRRRVAEASGYTQRQPAGAMGLALFAS